MHTSAGGSRGAGVRDDYGMISYSTCIVTVTSKVVNN